MNGIKQHSPGGGALRIPPKDENSSLNSALSEKALPVISGAASSIADTTKTIVSTNPNDQFPIPHSSANTQMADYVLVFQAISKKHLRSHTKVPASERLEIASEYQSLNSKIRQTGLRVTSRDGFKGSGQVLIFVQASDQLLDNMARQEVLTDYLHGVLSVQPPTSGLAGTQQKPALTITPASRIRFVHSLLTMPTWTPSAVQKTSSSTTVPSGAGLRVGLKQFPHLIDMSAIHDPDYNSTWVKRLAHTSPKSFLSGVGLKDLDSIREHFGEDVGLYFGFLNFYFQALAPLAVWGFSFWALDCPFSALYSFGLVIWACLTVELWRMRERKLAVRWGTAGVNKVNRRRDDFQPRIKRVDPATREEEEVFEWWRRELRVILSLPVMLIFASLLAATMTLMFAVEIFVTQLYHGPGKQAIPFIPTALLVVAIPQIMAAWQATAAALTTWENHYSTKSHDYSLTLKRFVLQGMVAYGALTLSAFIYIPFGEQIMQTLVERGFFRDSIQLAIQEGKIKPSGIDFEINPSRMHTQMFAVSVTSQAINSFTELVLPLILRKAGEWKKERDAKKKGEKGDSNTLDEKVLTGDDAQENRFVERVRKELELPPYDLFGDYAEMATQFGYITLWSVIWPLSPVMGFINNFFELRSDATKICVNQRRPIPSRAETIGPWLEVLGVVAWLAALTNSALVYLFQASECSHLPGHSAYETKLRSHTHPFGQYGLDGQDQSAFSFSRLLASQIPTSGPAGALVAAILVALTFEHAYGLFRNGVRHVLQRLVWSDSNEEMIVRRRAWQLGIETLKSRVTELQVPSNDNTGFWSTSKDVGAEVIRNSGKVE